MTRTSAAQFSLMACGAMMIVSSINDLLPGVNGTRLSLDIRSTDLTFELGVRALKRAILLFAMPVEIVIACIYVRHLNVTQADKCSGRSSSSPPTSCSRPNPTSTQLLSRSPRKPMWLCSGYLYGWICRSMRFLPSSFLLVRPCPSSLISLTSGVIDFFLMEKRYKPPMSTIGATALAVSFGSAYSIWVEHCATINGRFPYPFLRLMSQGQRVDLYAASTLGAMLIFWGLNAVHR